MEPIIALRELEQRDVPELVELVFKYKRETNRDFPASKRSEIGAAFFHAMESESTRVWVAASSAGRLEGYIAAHLTHDPMIAGCEIYVSDLLVAETGRGSGVGSMLLDRAERFGRERGAVRVMLNNPKASESYRRDFYKKRGYIERLEFANFVKYPEDDE